MIINVLCFWRILLFICMFCSLLIYSVLDAQIQRLFLFTLYCSRVYARYKALMVFWLNNQIYFVIRLLLLDVYCGGWREG